ncbi:MAG: hypothetical protein ACM3MH_00305 [Actinomycetota bacterium]
MTKRFVLSGAGFAFATMLALFSPPNRAVAEAGACHDLVGTYLTKNFAKGASGGDFTSRSLIALSGSGQASFIDSGEGGEAGFGPFTDGRGSWRCIEANKLHAVTLDFTTPTAEQPKADIGRLDFDLTYDPASKTIKGTATLRLVPLGSDPLAPGEGAGRQFEISGQRVEAP